MENLLTSDKAYTTDLRQLMDHWPLFYAGSVGLLKEWLMRKIAAALRKGDAQHTPDSIRELELTRRRRTRMATDIVAGEK